MTIPRTRTRCPVFSPRVKRSSSNAPWRRGGGVQWPLGDLDVLGTGNEELDSDHLVPGVEDSGTVTEYPHGVVLRRGEARGRVKEINSKAVGATAQRHCYKFARSFDFLDDAGDFRPVAVFDSRQQVVELRSDRARHGTRRDSRYPRRLDDRAEIARYADTLHIHEVSRGDLPRLGLGRNTKTPAVPSWTNRNADSVRSKSPCPGFVPEARRRPLRRSATSPPLPWSITSSRGSDSGPSRRGNHDIRQPHNPVVRIGIAEHVDFIGVAGRPRAPDPAAAIRSDR